MSETKSIIARCPKCQNTIFACINEYRVLDGETMKEIIELVKTGHNIEHMKMEDFRKTKFGCDCNSVTPKDNK